MSLSGMIGVIISVVLALMFILPITMGAFRGLKKSAFRLGWILIGSILVFVIVGAISKTIVNLDLSAFNIVVEGTQITSIPQYIELAITTSNPDIAQVIADNPEVYTMIVSLIVSVLNLFLVVILYWIFKWLLWPIWAIIAHFIFKNKKVKNTKILQHGKAIGEKQQVIKEKKHALWGACIGVVMGLISLVFTAIPLAGISNTLLQIEQATLTQQQDGTTKGVLSSNLGDDAELIYVYANSPGGKVLDTVGINQLSTAIAKNVASTEMNGVKTSALDEVVNITVLTNDVQSLSETDFSNLTKEQWTETLPKIEKVSNTVLSSGIIKTLYDSLVPYFIDNMLNDPDFFVQVPDTQNEIVNNLIHEVLLQVKTISVDDIKNDLSKIIQMADDLNNNEILTELVKGEVELEYLQQRLTVELGETLNEKFFEMQTIGKLVPICLQSAVEYACEQLDVEYVKSSANLTLEQTKQFFDSLINDAILVLQGYDETKEMPIATTTFENIGDVVDSLKTSGIINTTTFNNLVDYVADKITVQLDDLNLKQSVDTLVRSLLVDIKFIPSFKTELKQIGLAYQVILDEELDVEKIELEQITKILDKVLPTFLYQYNLDEIVNCAKELLTDYCEDSNLDIDSTTINTICIDIKKIQSFQLEYLKIDDLVEYVTEILQQNDLQSHLNNSETMSTLGEHLDVTVANGSILLSDTNCKLILQSIIKNIELPADLEGTVVNGQDILVVMANNAQNITSYQTEFVYISKILNITGTLTLSQYGEALDGVKNSVLLQGVLEQLVSDKINEKADIIEDAEIKQIVKDLTANVPNIQSYKTEFEYLNQIVNVDTNNINMTQFGAMLDSFVDSKLLGNKTNDLLSFALDKAEDEVDAIYQDIYSQVVNNVSNISGKVYEQELGYVQSFVDFTNNGEPKTRENIEQYLSDNILKADGSSKSILIDDQIVNDILALAI